MSPYLYQNPVESLCIKSNSDLTVETIKWHVCFWIKFSNHFFEMNFFNIPHRFSFWINLILLLNWNAVYDNISIRRIYIYQSNIKSNKNFYSKTGLSNKSKHKFIVNKMSLKKISCFWGKRHYNVFENFVF